SELTGVLTGVLLVTTIAADRHARRPRTHAAGSLVGPPFRAADNDLSLESQEMLVRNSQVAVLCGTMLAGSLIVAATNVWLVRSLLPGGARDRGGAPAAARAVASDRRLVIAMMPKAKGDPYFVSCREGAEEAARELGVDLIWDG